MSVQGVGFLALRYLRFHWVKTVILLACVTSTLCLPLTVQRLIGSRPLLASHPVYNYLARRYGWNLRSVHWDPDEAPLEAEWPALRELVRSHPARLMLWEDDPLPETVRRLGDLGITCVIFRPCGNRPGDGDYLSEMQANVTRLKRAVVSAP